MSSCCVCGGSPVVLSVRDALEIESVVIDWNGDKWKEFKPGELREYCQVCKDGGRVVRSEMKELKK